MESSGLRPGQVVQVRGFADQRLRKAGEPAHASNRRVSVIVQYDVTDQPPQQTTAEPAAEVSESHAPEAEEPPTPAAH